MNFSDNVSPELERLQHIGLVDTGQALAALLRRLECDVRNATDFRFGIAHGIETLALAFESAVRRRADTARLTEINVAGQFTDDKDIKSGHDFRLQRRSAGQFRIHDRRTQVGEQAEVLAQAENCLFRAQ